MGRTVRHLAKNSSDINRHDAIHSPFASGKWELNSGNNSIFIWEERLALQPMRPLAA